MFNCRVYDKPNGPKLHVHDDPGYTADALRCSQNGWLVSLDKCIDPETPFSDGDPKFVVSTIINLVRRNS